MPPAYDAWRVDPVDEHSPRTRDLAARLRVLKALEREYQVFLEYQATVASFDEATRESTPAASHRPADR